LLFIAPWLIGFLVFTVYPICASAYYSLTRYDVIRPPRFIGLENYVELMTRDRTMRIVTVNSLWWIAIAVPLGVVSPFLLANLLNKEFAGRSFFRAVFFMPSVIPVIASALTWQWLLNTNYGLINGFLMGNGLTRIPFLSSPELAKPTLAVIEAWAKGGSMVIFLAALQDVPRSLYEAAVVDGANAWHRFWYVTVPMCTPAMLFLLITGIIGGLQYFGLPWLLTGGGPNEATEFYSIYLYRNAFLYSKMGYASALAWILFILALTAALLVFRISGRWVYYRAG
jgi:multiple sugar transport system permease protein